MAPTKLAQIYEDIVADPASQVTAGDNYMPVYTASEKSKIVLVGQAPGRKAQESMTPWNDVSGDTLRKWLDVSREQFYNPELFALIPMDFYYPGKGAHGDLPPRKGFAAQWHPRILAEMPDIQLFVLIGAYAQAYYLGSAAKSSLTETVRSFSEYLPQYLPLVHPSPLNIRWQSKNPWFKDEVVPELQNLVHQIL